MADEQKPDNGKEEAKAPGNPITQPPAPPPQQPPAPPNVDQPRDNPQPPRPPNPILVQLVGGDDLEPFEEQTLTLARENLEVSRRAYRIAAYAFIAAAFAAGFVYMQVKEMSYQTQILASQSESAAAGAAIQELNTRTQIQSVQERFRLEQRPYIWVSSPTPTMPMIINFEVAQYNESSPKQIVIGVHYTNFGRSPALKIVQRHDIGIGNNAMNKIKLKPLPSAGESAYLLPPNKDDFFSVVSGPVKNEEIVQTNKTTVPLLLRDYAAAFRARFQYRDALGNKYQTDICMTRLQTGAFSYCPSGNAILDCSKEQCE